MTNLSQYPRPQLQRNSYFCLNGEWKYRIVNDGELFNFQKDDEYQGIINVPYSPETRLSNVNKTLLPDQALWYKKHVVLNNEFKEKLKDNNLFLNFGAVDQICGVFINGVLVSTHVGGYTPFSLNISEYVNSDEFDIELRVEDHTHKNELTRGKQSLKPGGIWYTAQSGIWQTVWLEIIPKKYIKNVKITPDAKNNEIDILVESNENGLCKVIIDDNEYDIEVNNHQKIIIDNPKYWELDNPYLYDVLIYYGDDSVKTYFGLRSFELKNVNGSQQLYMNGKPLFMNAILEQGYYDGGLYTPEDYSIIEKDIKNIKELGFNTIRKHIKIEPAIYYYLCDRAGMLVMQDMVNGGGVYNPIVVGAPLFFNVNLKDNKYGLFKRKNEIAKYYFEEEIRQVVNELYNFPSIAMWTIFNEAWGQYDSKRIFDMLVAIDNSRLIDPNSGWYDQKFGEIISNHCYFKKYRYKPDDLGRSTILSEYGGFSFGTRPKFTYANFANEDKYINKIRKVMEEQIIPFKEQGLIGAVYTQYNDIEDEKNGIVDEKRNIKVKKYKDLFKV